MSRAWHWIGRRLPHGWPDLLRQLLLFAGAYLAYRLVRGVIEGQGVTAAFENARELVHIERWLGLFFEPGLQAWALATSPVALDTASWIYVHSHAAITTLFLAWLYLCRNHAFYFVRDMFMIAMGLALAVYLLFPTAPPRMLPEWGFTDTVVGLVGTAASQGADILYNPFAAMPSMHVAFALMIAIPAMRLVSSRALKAAWATYPVLVTVVVVITANHFWIDAAFGALVAAFSAYLAQVAENAGSRESVPAEAPA